MSRNLIDVIEKRLTELAKDRLRNRPAALHRFIGRDVPSSIASMVGGAHGIAVKAVLSQSIDWSVTASGDPVAFDKRLLKLIDEWAAQQPAAVPVEPLEAGGGIKGGETGEQRQRRRYQMCIDACLTMPANDYAALPRGVGKLAKLEGIKTPSFTADVKAHIRRLNVSST